MSWCYQHTFCHTDLIITGDGSIQKVAGHPGQEIIRQAECSWQGKTEHLHSHKMSNVKMCKWLDARKHSVKWRKTNEYIS